MRTRDIRPASTDSGRRRAPFIGPMTRFYVKMALMMLVDALGVYGLFGLYTAGAWTAFWIMIAALIVVNVVYFHPRWTPAKYLVPGLAFLLVYQIFVVLYTGYAAFTNYGDGHNSTKEDALAQLLVKSVDRLPDSAQYPLSVVVNGNQVGFAVVDQATKKVQVGTTESPLADVAGATAGADGKVAEVPGWQVLKLVDILKRGSDFQKKVVAMRVPLSDDPAQGYLKTDNGSTAFVYSATMHYDAAADTLTDAKNNVVYTASDHGNFVAPDGTKLEPGWKVNVGFENFTRVLTDPNLRGPFFGVFLWTFAFSILTVLGSFIIGLFLALVLNDNRMRGRKVYRSLLILPYAFPALLSALVWRGLMNRDFGFFNEVLLGGSGPDWLGDPGWAKFSVVLVNCWLGFPYMFLVATGALQAIPADVTEAGAVDGANPWQIFWRLKFPLLMVSLAPLLISSFAFNFNNFNTIYMLTGGGPRDLSASVDVGATDILITFVYKLAFGGQDRQYGFATAVSIIIFVVVATISAISFRKTRALEDLN